MKRYICTALLLSLVTMHEMRAGDDDKLAVYRPGDAEVELSGRSKEMARVARSVLVGMWAEGATDRLSSLRVEPVRVSHTGRESVRLASDAFEIELDSENGSLIVFLDKSADKREISSEDVPGAVAHVRARDFPRFCGWADLGITFSYDRPRTRWIREGAISFPRIHEGFEFLSESFTVFLRKEKGRFKLARIGTNITFMQPEPSTINVSPESALAYFRDHILATPYIARELTDTRKSQNMQVVKDSVRLLDQRPVYLHKNQYLETGSHGPEQLTKLRLAYLCSIQLVGRHVTFDVIGYVDCEEKKLIGGDGSMRADR